MGTPYDFTQSDLNTDTSLVNNYDLVEGLCVLPVALTDAEIAAGVSPVVFVRLHPPYRVRKASYNASKINTPPIMPTPQSQGAAVFVGGSLFFDTPVLNQTLLNYNWSVKGTYLFVENVPSNPADGFLIGLPSTPIPSAQINNAGGSSPQPPSGAVAQAGPDAWNGYAQGLAIQFGSLWSYNCASFYSGVFFNDLLLNAAGVSLDPNG